MCQSFGMARDSPLLLTIALLGRINTMNDKVKEYVRWDKVTKKGNPEKGIQAGALHLMIKECHKDHPNAMCTDNVQAIVDKGMSAIGKRLGNREIMAIDFFTKPSEAHADGKVWSIPRGKYRGKELYLAFQLPEGAKNSNGTTSDFNIDDLV